MGEKIGQYEKAGIFRNAVDAPTDDRLGTAWLPDPREVSQHQGHDRIGQEYGPVQLLATGLQVITDQDGDLTRMTLFGSQGRKNSLHHYAFWYGSERERRRDAVLGVIQECPGMYFDLECGCSQCRDRVVKNVFDIDADAAVLVSYDPETERKERLPVAKGMFEALGLAEVRHLTTPYFQENCNLQQKLHSERSLHEVSYAPDGKVFIKSHDVNVKFRDGVPARMLIYEELPLEEKRGYGQKVKRHHVLVYGDIHDSGKPPIARYHSSCKTAEHGGNACDCRIQRERTLQMIREHGCGFLIYADEEGMNLGAVNKFWQTHITLGETGDIYKARDMLDMPRDVRTYGLIDVVRRDLHIERVSLASNNRKKKEAFEHNGVEVVSSMHLKADYSLLAPQAQADVLAKVNSGRYDNFAPKS